MSDLIDRQAAIDALGERPMVWMDSDYEIAQRNQYDMDKSAIEAVPSVTPKMRTGKWIVAGSEDGYWYKCSECGRGFDWKDHFCGECGAKMKESDE